MSKRTNRANKKESFLYELHSAPAYRFKPLTQKQQDLVTAIDHFSIITAIGSAGTGKTFCVTYRAAKYLLEGTVKKIDRGNLLY